MGQAPPYKLPHPIAQKQTPCRTGLMVSPEFLQPTACSLLLPAFLPTISLNSAGPQPNINAADFCCVPSLEEFVYRVWGLRGFAQLSPIQTDRSQFKGTKYGTKRLLPP